MSYRFDKRSFILQVLTNPGKPARVDYQHYEAANKSLKDEIHRLRSQAKTLQEALDSLDTK